MKTTSGAFLLSSNFFFSLIINETEFRYIKLEIKKNKLQWIAARNIWNINNILFIYY